MINGVSQKVYKLVFSYSNPNIILFILLSFIFILFSQTIQINKKNQKVFLYFIQDPKKVCKKIRYYFNNESISCDHLCVKNIPCGSIGNHIIELLLAYQFAKATGLNSVIFQKGFLHQTKSFIYSDIKIEIAPTPYKHYRKKCISYKFFVPFPKLPRVPFQIDAKFKEWYIQQFPEVTLPNDSLIMHVRSGDVFNSEIPIHPLYGQPPCRYYSDIMKMRNWSQVRIISENEDNPCVNVLKEMGGIFTKNDFKTDFSFLINAKNFVISRSSLCYAAILLSKEIKKLYTFNQSSSRIPNHLNCVPSEFFYRKVIVHWSNSEEQRNLILSSSCLKWEFVNEGNLDLKSYLHSVSI